MWKVCPKCESMIMGEQVYCPNCGFFMPVVPLTTPSYIEVNYHEKHYGDNKESERKRKEHAEKFFKKGKKDYKTALTLKRLEEYSKAKKYYKKSIENYKNAIAIDPNDTKYKNQLKKVETKLKKQY